MEQKLHYHLKGILRSLKLTQLSMQPIQVYREAEGLTDLYTGLAVLLSWKNAGKLLLNKENVKPVRP